jgi:Domain of unknown function (DUF4167)
MRPQQQNRRMRGRNNGGGGGNNNNNNNNNNNRRGPNPLTRNYESNGPDVKIRGSAQQIAEKYSTLARDAHSSGDRVMAENYLQHAEHYNRIIAAAQAQFASQQIHTPRDDMDDDLDDAGYGFEGGVNGNGGDGNQPQQQPQQSMQHQPQPEIGSGPQPVIEGVPAEVALNSEPAGQRHQGGNRHRDRRNEQRHFRHDVNGGGSGVSNSVGEQVVGEQPQVAAVVETAAQETASPQAASPEAVTPAEQELPPRRGRKPRRSRSADQGEAGEAAPDAAGVPEVVTAES